MVVAAVGVVSLLALAGPAVAQGESVELMTSTHPTQDVPMKITASGVANGSDKLFVYVDEVGRECTSDPHASYGEYLTTSGGEAVTAGAYSSGIHLHADLHRIQRGVLLGLRVPQQRRIRKPGGEG